jgi:hypothetical protein
MANPTTNTNVTRAIAQTSQYIQEKWTRDVEKPFYKSLQAAKLVQRRDGLVANGGDVINVPFMSIVDARAKAASTDVVYDSPEGAPVTIAIDKHYYSAVKIEDIAAVQSSYELKSMFQEAQAEAVARQIDTDVLGLYGSAGNTVAAGAAVDDADILQVVNYFDTNNVPMSGRRGIIGANTKNDLLNVNKYVAYDQTGKTGVAVADNSDNFFTSLYNMDIYMSTNVPTSTTGRNLFFHKKAITLAEQLKPTYKVEWSVDSIAWKTVLHAIYGVGVERASAMIQLTRTTAP